MYLKTAQEEDSKMTERWQKDANGILIFVSTQVKFHATPGIDMIVQDGSVLCRRRFVAFSVDPGY
jgi:hypothetical protein